MKQGLINGRRLYMVTEHCSVVANRRVSRSLLPVSVNIVQQHCRDLSVGCALNYVG